MVRPGGDSPTRRSSWIASRGRGRRARDRRSHARRARRRGLGRGRAGPVRRSVVSGSFTRVGGLDARRPDARGSWPAAGFSRPSGGPVAAVAMPSIHRGLGEGTREPWGPLGPGPCDPGRDSPDRVTVRSQTSPLGDRPPDPRPGRHRMETTAQDSSPRPPINHCLKNLYHSSLLLDCFWSRINHLGTGRPSSSATRLSEVTDNSSDQPYEIRLNVDAVRDAIEVDDSSIPLRGCGFWGLAPCGLLVGGRPSRGSSAAVGASGGALVGRGVCSGS